MVRFFRRAIWGKGGEAELSISRVLDDGIQKNAPRRTQQLLASFRSLSRFQPKMKTNDEANVTSPARTSTTGWTGRPVVTTTRVSLGHLGITATSQGDRIQGARPFGSRIQGRLSRVSDF